jgi:hypothetical protein
MKGNGSTRRANFFLALVLPLANDASSSILSSMRRAARYLTVGPRKYLLLFLILAVPAVAAPDAHMIELLRQVPSVYGGSYSPRQMVSVANEFISLGEKNWQSILEECGIKSSKTGANQSTLQTPGSGTPAASAPVAPPPGAAGL